jgi:hypothetical protein
MVDRCTSDAIHRLCGNAHRLGATRNVRAPKALVTYDRAVHPQPSAGFVHSRTTHDDFAYLRFTFYDLL